MQNIEEDEVDEDFVVDEIKASDSEEGDLGDEDGDEEDTEGGSTSTSNDGSDASFGEESSSDLSTEEEEGDLDDYAPCDDVNNAPCNLDTPCDVDADALLPPEYEEEILPDSDSESDSPSSSSSDGEGDAEDEDDNDGIAEGAAAEGDGRGNGTGGSGGGGEGVHYLPVMGRARGGGAGGVSTSVVPQCWPPLQGSPQQHLGSLDARAASRFAPGCGGPIGFEYGGGVDHTSVASQDGGVPPQEVCHHLGQMPSESAAAAFGLFGGSAGLIGGVDPMGHPMLSPSGLLQQDRHNLEMFHQYEAAEAGGRAGTAAAAGNDWESGGICRRTRAHVNLRDVPIESLEQALDASWVEGEVEAAEEEGLWHDFLQGLVQEDALLPEEDEDEDAEFDIGAFLEELEDFDLLPLALDDGEARQGGRGWGASLGGDGVGGLAWGDGGGEGRWEEGGAGGAGYGGGEGEAAAGGQEGAEGIRGRGRGVRRVTRGLTARRRLEVAALAAVKLKPDPTPPPHLVDHLSHGLTLPGDGNGHSIDLLLSGGVVLPAPPSLCPLQLQQLYEQVYLHTQLVAQLYAMTCKDPHEEAERIANNARQMLLDLGQASWDSRLRAEAAGTPALTPLQLGLRAPQAGILPPPNLTEATATGGQAELPQGLIQHGVQHPPPLGGEDPHTSTEASHLSMADMWAPTCLEDVKCVLDVAPLRMLPAFFATLDALPSFTLEDSPMREILSLEAVGAAARKQARKRSKTGPPAQRAVDWVSPALAVLEPYLNPRLIYHPAPAVPHTYWSPGEDELLAIGIRRLGCHYDQLQAAYFPTRTKEQLLVRQKNLMARRKADLAAASLTGGSGSGSGSSAVVGAKISVEGPLTEEEIKQIRSGLLCMGLDPVASGSKGATRQIVWDRISTDLLPLRKADVLRKLWRELTLNGSRDPSASAYPYGEDLVVGPHARRDYYTGEEQEAGGAQHQPQQQQAAGAEFPAGPGNGGGVDEGMWRTDGAMEHEGPSSLPPLPWQQQQGGVSDAGPRQAADLGSGSRSDQRLDDEGGGDARASSASDIMQGRSGSIGSTGSIAAASRPNINTLLGSHLEQLRNLQGYRKAVAEKQRSHRAAALRTLQEAQAGGTLLQDPGTDPLRSRSARSAAHRPPHPLVGESGGPPDENLDPYQQPLEALLEAYGRPYQPEGPNHQPSHLRHQQQLLPHQHPHPHSPDQAALAALFQDPSNLQQLLDADPETALWINNLLAEAADALSKGQALNHDDLQHLDPTMLQQHQQQQLHYAQHHQQQQQQPPEATRRRRTTSNTVGRKRKAPKDIPLLAGDGGGVVDGGGSDGIIGGMIGRPSKRAARRKAAGGTSLSLAPTAAAPTLEALLASTAAAIASPECYSLLHGLLDQTGLRSRSGSAFPVMPGGLGPSPFGPSPFPWPGLAASPPHDPSTIPPYPLATGGGGRVINGNAIPPAETFSVPTGLPASFMEGVQDAHERHHQFQGRDPSSSSADPYGSRSIGHATAGPREEGAEAAEEVYVEEVVPDSEDTEDDGEAAGGSEDRPEAAPGVGHYSRGALGAGDEALGTSGRGGYGFAMTTTMTEGSAEDGTVRQHPQHLQQQPVQQHPHQLQHQPVPGSSNTWSEADDLVVLQTFVGMGCEPCPATFTAVRSALPVAPERTLPEIQQRCAYLMKRAAADALSLAKSLR